MKRTYAVLTAIAIFALSWLSGACGYQQKPAPAPPGTRPAEEKAIRALVVEWGKAMNAKDLEKSLSFYADEAQVFPPGQPVATTKEQRRQIWAQAFALPGFAISLTTTKVEVARSGDLASETGSFEETANDKKGKPVTTRGKYVVVWYRQADGSWKAVADIWNADQ